MNEVYTSMLCQRYGENRKRPGFPSPSSVFVKSRCLKPSEIRDGCSIRLSDAQVMSKKKILS